MEDVPISLHCVVIWQAEPVGLADAPTHTGDRRPSDRRCRRSPPVWLTPWRRETGPVVETRATQGVVAVGRVLLSVSLTSQRIMFLFLYKQRVPFELLAETLLHEWSPGRCNQSRLFADRAWAPGRCGRSLYGYFRISVPARVPKSRGVPKVRGSYTCGEFKCVA